MYRTFFVILLFLNILSVSNAENIKNKITPSSHEWNIYSGTFDFSDDKKRSTLFGIQHQNEDLKRKSFLGTLSPVTGFIMTADSSTYFYTGVQAEYKIGKINLVPSFTPGYYNKGDGKDLGHKLEFKSEVHLSLDLFANTELGISYNHISNASLGDKNPGANSYMLNLLKNF